jgi:chaperonin GroES
MTAEAELLFRPLSSLLRVKRAQAAGMTAGGILLPDVARRRPAEGTVVAAGPGRARPDGNRSVVWETAGDVILFQPSDFHAVTSGFDGLVSAERVVATILVDEGFPDSVEPANDYVKIRPDAAQAETHGGILLPEDRRERAQRGVILAYGPGEVRLSGPLAGTRRPVRAIIGVDEDERLLHRTVWWEGAHKALEVGGEDPCLLVKAADLMFLEVPDPE